MSHILRAPHLWPRGRTPELVVSARAELEGWFTIELIHARSGLIARRLHFRNLLTNGGMNLIGSSTLSTILSHFAVGTSSTAPDVTQVALGAQAGITNSNGGFADVASAWIAGNSYAYVRRTRVFTEAQANGNLTEVGIFTAASGGTMFCRSLLKDSGGSATTIVKTDEFQLRIDYEVRLYPPAAWGDYTFDAPVNGVSGTFNARPLGTGNAGAWNVFNFGGAPNTGTPTISVNNFAFCALATDVALRAADSLAAFSVAATSRTNTAYAADSHYREQTQEWNGSVANGVNYLLQGWNGLNATFQWLFPVALNKTNTFKFVIVARAHWARRP